MIVREHYLHRPAPCSQAFGLLDTTSGDFVGVIAYGTPSSATLRSGIAGPEYARDVVELTRLWVADTVERNGESFLIGNTLPLVTKRIVVSFAEIAAHHVGTVYQATNWLYTGLSAKRTDWTVEGMPVHGQTLADAYSAAEIRAKYGGRFALRPRGRKHRYLYLNCNRRDRRSILMALRYPILPYPKASL